MICTVNSHFDWKIDGNHYRPGGPYLVGISSCLTHPVFCYPALGHQVFDCPFSQNFLPPGGLNCCCAFPRKNNTRLQCVQARMFEFYNVLRRCLPQATHMYMCYLCESCNTPFSPVLTSSVCVVASGASAALAACFGTTEPGLQM